MNIVIRPNQVLKFFLSVIGLLLLANIAGVIAKHFMNFPHIKTFIRLVDFDTEMNIATLYSSCAMLVAAIGLLLIGYTHYKREEASVPWFGLSLIFVYLAIDETSAFHEMFVHPVRDAMGASGIFYFAWVIPYGVLALILAATYLKFYLGLASNMKKLFALAATLFFCGAIGFELLGGALADSTGEDTLIYSISYTCEETLEMLGIATLIYALSKYISQTFPVANVSLES
ncbi:hypothetical protein [Vibrio sp. HN007]|uniref:hypothetical protein n=1 Tax=Vibrio iocasae TaxID=3098914 RepID=UPI0035D4A71E